MLGSLSRVFQAHRPIDHATTTLKVWPRNQSQSGALQNAAAQSTSWLSDCFVWILGRAIESAQYVEFRGLALATFELQFAHGLNYWKAS